MKVLPFFLITIFIGVAIFCGVNYSRAEEVEKSYLRIHIIANSNSEDDKEIKLLLKDRIVDYLTPLVNKCADSNQAQEVVKENISIIEEIGRVILINAGVDYTMSININNKKCPSRMYNDLVLDEGLYDVVTITLGSGLGDNWWCVVYPPLCFVNKKSSNEQDIIYKSRLKEYFDNLFN